MSWMMARVPDQIVSDVAATFERVRVKHGLKQDYIATVMLMSQPELRHMLTGRQALNMCRLMLLNVHPDTKAFHEEFLCEIAAMSGFETPDLVAHRLRDVIVAIVRGRRQAKAETGNEEQTRRTA